METISKATWDLIQAQVYAIKMRGIGLDQAKTILKITEEDDNNTIHINDDTFCIRNNRCSSL
jgi:hypothetical protein